MFVFTVKSRIKKPKRALVLAIFAILLIGGIIYIAGDSANSTANCKTLGEYSTRFSTDGDKKKFLSTFSVQGDLVTIDKVIIPEKFNALYERYNKIQKKMGLDLEEYKGKTAKRFVYQTKDNWYVSVLTYKNRVIACHKCTNIYGDDFLSLLDDKAGKKAK